MADNEQPRVFLDGETVPAGVQVMSENGNVYGDEDFGLDEDWVNHLGTLVEVRLDWHAAVAADKARREAAVRPAEVHSPAPTPVSEGGRVGETSTEAHSGVHWCSPDCVDPDTWDASCPLNAGLDGPPVHSAAPVRVPRVWQAGDPDNPPLGEVKAVTDRLGEQWFPSLRADYATSWFCDREAQNRSWSRLLAEFGPLTEVVE